MTKLLLALLPCLIPITSSVAAAQVNLTPAGGMANLQTSLPSEHTTFSQLSSYGTCVVADDREGSIRYVLARRSSQRDQTSTSRFDKASWRCQRLTGVSQRWLKAKDVKVAAIADALRQTRP